MKLWLATSGFPPTFDGGIAAYAAATADAWGAVGHALRVFVYDHAVRGAALVRRTPREGLTVVRFGDGYAQDPTWRLEGLARRAWQYAAAVAEEIIREGPPDVIEAQDYQAVGYFMAMRRLTHDPIFADVPLVVTVHAPKFLLDAYEQAPVHRLPDFWVGEMERATLAAADGVIFPSQYVADAVGHQVTPQRAAVIPNPYAGAAGTPRVDHRRVANRVVFVGVLQRLKGVVELFDAMARLWDSGRTTVLDVVAGDGWYFPRAESMRAYLASRYAPYVGRGLVVFHGRLSPGALAEVALRAPVAVVPSLFENFPYAVLEAMARGQVVVATDAGGQRELIRSGDNGILCRAGDAADLSASLAAALDLAPARRMAMGDAARATVAEWADAARVTAVKAAWLEETVAQRPLPPSFPFVQPVAALPTRPADRPKLTVIVPYFNLGAYVEETVTSVLASTVPPDEVLIIDDASHDPESVARLYRLAERHPAVSVLRCPHGGLAAARNAGAAAAHGLFLAFVDADDQVEPDYFARALTLLAAYDNVSMVGCWMGSFGDRREVWPTWSTGSPYLLYHNSFPAAAMVVRRDAFVHAGRNDPALAYGMEDWESAIGLWLAGYGGVVIPEPLYRYRLRAGSMSRGDNPGSLLDTYRRIIDKHHEALAPYLPEVLGLLNANGPQYLAPHPTRSTWWVEAEAARS